MATTGFIRLGGLGGVLGGALAFAWSVLWAFFGDSVMGPPPGYAVRDPLLYAVLVLLLGAVVLLFSVGLLGLHARLAPGRRAGVGGAGRLLAVLAAVASAAVVAVSLASPPVSLGLLTVVSVAVALVGLLAATLLLGIAALGSDCLGRFSALPLMLFVVTLLLFVLFPAFRYVALVPGALAGAGWAFLGYLLLAKLEESGRRAAPL